MNRDAYYPIPCDSWLPTLLDIEHFKQLEGPMGEYYQQFGWENIEVDATKYPRLASHMADLKVMFDERYAFRMIGQETLERWQMRLQYRFDALAERIEMAYTAFDMYQDQLLADLLPGKTTKTEGSNTASGTDTTIDEGSSVSKFSDTPDNAINESDEYANSVTKDTRGNTRNLTHGRKDTIDMVVTENITGKELLNQINEFVTSYTQVDEYFVSKFNNLFLGVYD